MTAVVDARANVETATKVREAEEEAAEVTIVLFNTLLGHVSGAAPRLRKQPSDLLLAKYGIPKKTNRKIRNSERLQLLHIAQCISMAVPEIPFGAE